VPRPKRFVFLFSACVALACAQARVPLFDGRTFAGWEGNTGSVWRIADGALVAGTLERPQEKNDFLATTKAFANFDLTLKWKLEGTRGFVNGGVQFRSQRIPNHHEVIGYQADLGAGWDGALYDESRRRTTLARPAPDVLEKARKPLGEWNDYRIRAEGRRIRIWLNGVQTVDYTETVDGIAATGIIAVQIHGNATAVVHYKDLVIEELPAGADPVPPPAFRFEPDDDVALVGGSNIERTRFDGSLQLQFVAARPEANVRVRNFGWEGDTVFEQWRDAGQVEQLDGTRRAEERRHQEAAGTTSWRQQRDWRQQLGEAGATAVIAQFGQMESLRGLKELPAFVAAYDKLIAELADGGRRLVLVSPMPFEGTLATHNAAVVAYALAVAELARKHGLTFVDLSLLAPGAQPLTDNGWQLNAHGHRIIAAHIARALGLTPQTNEAVRREILEAERLWFDTWRPMNWAFLTGDRTEVPYSKDWKDSAKRIFPEEMRDFEPLLKQADENIWAALAGRPTVPITVRSSVPVEPPTAKPHSPDEELASFTILDGFQVNLFASEADGVVKPVQMRWDQRGRLWVVCTLSYPQIKPGEKANDYILVCEDTDGDGRADKFQKFAEGLFMPTGLELGDGGVYVAQGTELLHLSDTDGDGRADTRRIVLGGFGTADSHQMINCINWGFGGELWFTQGHHIYSRVETRFGVETLNRAGVWRYRPRSGHLDPFFQFSSAGANCWGVITTDYGQPFHKSGANIGGYFSTPGLVRSGLPVNAQPMNLFLAPLKQVGMEFVGSSHFPDEMQGHVVIGGYYGSKLEQHSLRYEDGRYTSTLLPNIIETKNNVFRPVEVRGGPDGALYVADWYNPIIGHYQASYRHPDRDKAHGRIWRVTAKDRPLAKPPRLAGAGLTELFEQLDSPERWVKYQVKRLLFERDSRQVTAALDAWVSTLRSGAKDDYRRLQALSVYEAHDAPRHELLKTLLRCPDARIRAYATRTLSTWARGGWVPEALAWLEPQIADDEPLVRLEAIVAASYLAEPRAAVVAARALDKPFNDYHRHALTKTLHATLALWSPRLTAGELDFDRDEHLAFALQNSWIDHAEGAAAKITALMRRQIERQQNSPARQSVWLQALAARATATDLRFVLERGGQDADVLAALATAGALRSAAPPDAAALLEPAFASPLPAVRSQAVRLAGLWKLAPFADRIHALAGDAAAPLPLRRAALAALGDFGGPAATTALLGVIDTAPSPELRAAALGALVVANPAAAAQQVLARLDTAATVEEAAALLRTLLARAEGSAALARALARPDALGRPAARLALNALNRLGGQDRKLPPLLMRLAGIDSALPAYTRDYVINLVKSAQTFGDPAVGRKLYEQAGCVACHIPGAAQSKIGPDLSALSRGLPIDMIVTEVVWPALNVKEGYEAATVTLKDGSVVTGFKHTDTAESIAIRDMATGEVKTIRRSDAADIRTGGTVMPDGLTATLDERQLAHLIRYLSELGR
jgi:putative heme-binding domain-containing protein